MAAAARAVAREVEGMAAAEAVVAVVGKEDVEAMADLEAVRGSRSLASCRLIVRQM